MDCLRSSIVTLFLLLTFPLLGRPAATSASASPDSLEWLSHDIGDVGAEGSSELIGPDLVVRGSGADVWGTTDEFHFAHTSVDGDFELTALVRHVDDVHRWTKAGLMIREGLAPDARHAFLLATPRTERGVAFQRRSIAGGSSVHTAGPAVVPPVWLRLTRRGDFVAASMRVSDTDAWTAIGEQHLPGLPHTLDVGFAVSSHVDGVLAEAWFERIALESLDDTDATWNTGDVGDVGAAGHAMHDGDSTFTVTGAGADVWGTADAFHFAWREVTGNFELIAWVSSIDNVHVWTKAGLMMRESLDPGARHAFVLATPTAAKGLAFQRRLTTGGSSVHTAGPALAPGVWLRLVRTGDVVTAYYRHDQATEGFWVGIGSQTFASLPSTMLVGFAVTSHERGMLARAIFEEVELSLGSPEWQSNDIGDLAAAGRSSVDEQSGPEFTVTGSGADVWGTADELHFLSREVVGDFDFSARMAAVDDIHRWTKAGLMMRDGLAAHARHAFVIQTPRADRGVAFQRRPVTEGSSLHTTGPATPPPGFLRLVREGDLVHAYHKVEPTDAWTLIGSQTFTGLPATVRIGFAVSSHVDGTLATGHFDNLRLVR